VKRFLLTIITFVYLATASGANLHFHFCMGNLEGWGLWADESEQCGNCGMDKSSPLQDDGCCKDEFQAVKLQIDQKANAAFITYISAPAIESNSPFQNLFVQLQPQPAYTQPSRHAPERSPNIQVFLRCRNFRV
jgi:hypothetical protein